ncbi:MerR family transcriptional regulator [Isoptericola variabilis]|uniref:Transcriptional regulator, MerR family n=1 Tax=Isoptericola variabilis (strain 225) TaxID=743718 RepID=F6FUZ3_ISOV2|nr:MerR family transcriptional regulator [Isoptericola variabilis]AEG44333.1 transcriptional regulator, MerR family [Isoptericola variabilis 225]TWH31079.1 putative transcriptional regulators [Isoptericola variabilis J7]
MTSAHAARDPEPRSPEAPEPWPRGISRQATMRISDVLAQLGPEFPSISHSKLRFLEEQGLIDPVRTPSGYRQYSPADVERLRFVLTEQRDSYLPLKVIKERLAAMDAGEPAPGPAPRLADGAADDGSSARRRWTAESLAEATGTSTELVQQLVMAGVLRPGPGGWFEAGAADVVRIVARLAEYGIEPRHLRPLRTSADRHVGLVDQLVAPYRKQQTPSARAQAATLGAEVGELLARLHTAWVRQGVADLG